MTFNPVDAWAPSNPKEVPNQACEVSREKRIGKSPRIADLSGQKGTEEIHSQHKLP